MSKILGSILSFVLLIPMPVFAFSYFNWSLDNAPLGWGISNSNNILTVIPVSGNSNATIEISGNVSNNTFGDRNLGVVFNNIDTFILDKGNMRINISLSNRSDLLIMSGNNQFGINNQPNDSTINSLITPVHFGGFESSIISIEIKFTGDAHYRVSSPCTLTFSN